jgi:hypothetical protein
LYTTKSFPNVIRRVHIWKRELAQVKCSSELDVGDDRNKDCTALSKGMPSSL